MDIKDPLEQHFWRAILSWGKWVALITATGVIFNYGVRFQAIASVVDATAMLVEKHDKIINSGDRWTKQDHQYYENAVDKRLTVLEAKVDKIYLILLKQVN